MPEINVDEKEPDVLVGSCDGIVVLQARELPNYFDGYRFGMIIGMAIAIPLLLFVAL